jgi:hypothetical protein
MSECALSWSRGPAFALLHVSQALYGVVARGREGPRPRGAHPDIALRHASGVEGVGESGPHAGEPWPHGCRIECSVWKRDAVWLTAAVGPLCGWGAAGPAPRRFLSA